MNIYNIDELDIIHDKFLIVGKIYFQLLIERNREIYPKFTAIWTPTAPWLVEKVELPIILY
jgi:hypothetical protein